MSSEQNPGSPRPWLKDPRYTCFDLAAYQQSLANPKEGMHIQKIDEPVYIGLGMSIVRLAHIDGPLDDWSQHVYEITNVCDPGSLRLRFANSAQFVIGRETTPELNLDDQVSRRHAYISSTPGYGHGYIALADLGSTNDTRVYVRDASSAVEHQRKQFIVGDFQQRYQ